MVHHEQRNERLRQSHVRAPRRTKNDLTDVAPWHKPAYQVVEASLEVSAYYLAKR